MTTFTIIKYIQGIEFKVACRAKSLVKAAAAMGETQYHLRQYGMKSIRNQSLPTDGEAYATVGLGGEIRAIFQPLQTGWAKLENVKKAVEAYRQKTPTRAACDAGGWRESNAPEIIEMLGEISPK